MKILCDKDYYICVHSENIDDTVSSFPYKAGKVWYKCTYEKLLLPDPFKKKHLSEHYVIKQDNKDVKARKEQIRKDIVRTLWATKGRSQIVMNTQKLLKLEEILSKAPYIQTLLGTSELDMHIRLFLLKDFGKKKKNLDDFIKWTFLSDTPSLKLIWIKEWPKGPHTPLTYYSVEIRTPLGLLPCQSLIITSTRVITGNISEITDEKLYCINEWKEALYPLYQWEKALYPLYQGVPFGELFAPPLLKKPLWRSFSFNSWQRTMCNSQAKNIDKKINNLLDLLRQDPATEFVMQFLVNYLKSNEPIKKRDYLPKLAVKHGWKPGEEMLSPPMVPIDWLEEINKLQYLNEFTKLDQSINNEIEKAERYKKECKYKIIPLYKLVEIATVPPIIDLMQRTKTWEEIVANFARLHEKLKEDIKAIDIFCFSFEKNDIAENIENKIRMFPFPSTRVAFRILLARMMFIDDRDFYTRLGRIIKSERYYQAFEPDSLKDVFSIKQISVKNNIRLAMDLTRITCCIDYYCIDSYPIEEVNLKIHKLRQKIWSSYPDKTQLTKILKEQMSMSLEDFKKPDLIIKILFEELKRRNSRKSLGKPGQGGAGQGRGGGPGPCIVS